MLEELAKNKQYSVWGRVDDRLEELAKNKQ